MFYAITLFAEVAEVQDTMLSRIVTCAIAAIAGVFFIVVGLKNVREKKAEESGSRRSVNTLLGQSNSYEGNTAVLLGYLRIACGVAAIIFGIVFLFVGPFLADK